MSTLYGIAAVTAVLKDLLNNGLVDGDIASTVADNVRVTALPPDRIEIGNGTERSQLNVFLYRTTLNPGWRNAGLPARDRSGFPVSRDPLVLDLHYIVSAYGAEELHSEILLGHAMQLLHEHPVLARESIALSLAGPDLVPEDEELPPMLRALASSSLDEQVEMIKITPLEMSIEDMTKVWTSFQVSYRPSAAYLVTAVIIESRHEVRAGPPVQTRNLAVVARKTPIIRALLGEAAPGENPSEFTPFQPGRVAILRGRQLMADRTVLRVGGGRIEPHVENVSDTEIRFTIPSDLRAGMHSVSVLHEVELGDASIVRPVAESNQVALLLRPSVNRQPDDSFDVSVNDLVVDGGLVSAVLDVRLTPDVERRQRVELLLNLTNASAPAGFRVPAEPLLLGGGATSTDVVTFRVEGVPVGDYLLRVSVDGAESLLIPSEDPAAPGFTDPLITLGP